MMEIKKPSTKAKIIEAFQAVAKEVNLAAKFLTAKQWLNSTDDKWSPAENVQHLIISTHPVAKALKLPKIILLAFGRPKKPSRSYTEIVQFYQQLLSEGAKASAKYTPREKEITRGKNELLNNWERTTTLYVKNLKSWKEEKLDNYYLPHPVLGKLTVREMLLFTNYHIGHHCKNINNSKPT